VGYLPPDEQEAPATLRQRIRVPFEPQGRINAVRIFRRGEKHRRNQQTSIQGINRMSRPQKIHKPIKGGFNQILGAVAMGSGRGKQSAIELQRRKEAMRLSSSPTPKKP